ncbi:MAG: capsule biosynthesis protein [Dehalococcoidia bacterium]|jgi:hypothetical protein|nr:MAG: capsule biosynthesis protein [Dehalococcoidia bacterium]
MEARLKRFLGQVVLRSATLKRLSHWYASRNTKPNPDWRRILSADRELWDKALKAAENGPRILIASSNGWELPALSLEGSLAAALTLRGANVHFLLCDELLPACQACIISFYPDQKQFARHGPSRDICKWCFKTGLAIYRPLGLPVHRYGDFISPQDRQNAAKISATLPLDEINQYTLDGIAVGEHAMAGALRFYARGTLENEPHAEPILRRYFRAALLATYAVRRLLASENFECAVFHHGIYVPQGLVGEACRRMKVRVVNECAAYRKTCFIFSHGDTYHHTLMNEPTTKWESIKWNPEIDAEIGDYLKSRWYGTRDWVFFQEKPVEDLNEIARQLGVDFSRPTIGMLTNVMWDAQLHYPANAFPGMLDWVLQTISYFSRRPDLQLLIRVHPAEILGVVPSRQPIVDEVKKAFPDLPKNVFIIPPESKASTYAAMQQCDAVIIYGTKTGVELTAMGIPVVAAGEAWIRNKGVTMDVSSASDYFRLLDGLPLRKRLEEATINRARKYAYHFFFRRMIPLEFMAPTGTRPIYQNRLSSLEELLPGRSRGLDVICDGILEGKDFIYPAEEYRNTPPVSTV